MFFKNDLLKGTSGENEKLKARIAELEKELAAEKEKSGQGEQKINILNTNAHLGVWTAYYDEKAELQSVIYTDEFRKMLGYSRTEFPDDINALSKIIHPDEVADVFAAYGAAVADATNRVRYDIDYRLLTKDKGYKWFHATGDCIRKSNGNPQIFIGTFTDVDEQHKNEESLESIRLRRLAIDRMQQEGSWSLDLKHNAIDDLKAPMTFSKSFKKILGYENGSDFPDVMESWCSRIHPDDVEKTNVAIGKQMRDVGGKSVAQTEFRMRHRDGTYHWVRSSSTIMWEGSVPVLAAGLILDITNHKNNELMFETEMAPKLASLREGVTGITSSVSMATKQMSDMAERQIDVADFAKQIEKAVDDSMEIISSIQSIANQTNLLSLNASIEAARAGEAGKGFAVVAGEVQNLANSTKETTNHISQILQGINQSIKEMLGKLSQISETMETENAAMEEIDATVKDLHQFAEEIGDMGANLYH